MTTTNEAVNETETATHLASVEAYSEFLDTHYEAADAKKVKAFIEWGENNRNLDSMLMINTIDQFDVEGFLQYAEDVASHGVAGGFSGWTWYDETEAFYLANKDAIIAWAKDQNESIGEGDSYLAMIASFNIMKQYDLGLDEIAEFIYTNDKELDNFTHFANNMAWVIAEEVCRNYVDFLEEYEEDEEDEEDFSDDGYE
ncbi:MAG: hypothetical protein VYA60_07900 [Pseudomonadota bacterium]|nr:hypothetical protein [Pseudomonadota bacterium]